ncbi:MAG: hypothetical protein MMC33_010485 [Icmadophila ericetorum]|nr:hypothetical protein [Icmadophila ericetorum]
MSSRLGLRQLQFARLGRGNIRSNVYRRYQVTDAAAGAPGAPAQSLVQRLWHSPVGVKTVHFWAPVMKWALVLTGVSDFWRPADKLSLTQNVALTATGAIWTRWCLIIKPRNVLLAAVNFFLGCVGVIQVSRILMYQRTGTGEPISQIAKKDAEDASDSLQSVSENSGEAVKDALR